MERLSLYSTRLAQRLSFRRHSRPVPAEHRPVQLLHIGIALVLTLTGAVVIVGGILGAAVAWLGLPKSPPVLDTTSLLEIIKISLAVVAGIGGAVALVVAYRKQRLAEEDSHRENTRLYAERFDKATDKLGSDAPPVRLAGVHALAALADDWEGGRQMCIDVLCAYLRMPPDPEPHADHDPTGHSRWRAMREVRRTILRLIATHLRSTAQPSWSGTDMDFTGVIFDEDANFEGAVFSGGKISFDGAELSGGTVSFYEAEFLDGEISFDTAKFSGGLVSFRRATFSGSYVTFIDATFSGGAVSFAEAEFTGSPVVFRLAEFPGGEVSFTEAMFSGGFLFFDGTVFSGAKVDFNGADFSGGSVSPEIRESFGGRVSFASAAFSDGTVSFNEAKFSNDVVSFAQATFPGGEVTFNGAQFSAGEVSFTTAQFSGGTIAFNTADFSGSMVAFAGAEFAQGTVSFNGAAFSAGSVSFDQAEFSGGVVLLNEPRDWSHPPTGLPDQAPGLRLPASLNKTRTAPQTGTAPLL
ncbi:pentapeptide repeat-containing protein [Planotetraspora kaengkrachanensis]|uniref:pentapeptide repeat-containing protein n=1 Tax=Planotetraspora kaengkrachanensis TaxID=575193 RepID=UPI001944BBE1|nr:pentapeptide repeat-containing protein [Planotetraspora kaengkrachanensis]